MDDLQRKLVVELVEKSAKAEEMEAAVELIAQLKEQLDMSSPGNSYDSLLANEVFQTDCPLDRR